MGSNGTSRLKVPGLNESAPKLVDSKRFEGRVRRAKKMTVLKVASGSDHTVMVLFEDLGCAYPIKTISELQRLYDSIGFMIEQARMHELNLKV